MEESEELKSIQGYLPLVARGSSLFWASQAVETLKDLVRGRVNSGEQLFEAISDLRHSLSASSYPLSPAAADGYALFFDDVSSSISLHSHSLPLELHYIDCCRSCPRRNLASGFERCYRRWRICFCDSPLCYKFTIKTQINTAFRLLHSQQPGLVLLSQEIISALLGCSLLCLFPVNDRSAEHLPTINFDHLFAALYEDYNQKQESKIWCIIHYFERITSCMPTGFVSFERKVIQRNSYPNPEFWSSSDIPLCRLEVHRSGLIEDQSSGALEVDFANKYIGGGALHRGCVQEEIRFMINPELIASMLFMPSMADNEAIEIIGAERFSNYTGYASSFRFCGDYVDQRDPDFLGRRKTRIIAIDALCSPGMKQYKQEFLLRETNKAFCGFLHHSGYREYNRLVQGNKLCSVNSIDIKALEFMDDIGIATGNWGCGAFGGDPEVKSIVQWLAASQALRPFISYYTFGIKALETLDQVSRWIQEHEWTVGDLWDLLVEYVLQKWKGETHDGFFSWLLPSLLASDADMSE